MKTRKHWGKIAGLVLHTLIGGLLIFTGSQKVLASVPPESLVKYGLAEQSRLIGAGAILTALLLLIPRTSALGLLLASAFWGGTICIDMAHGEPCLFQAAMLVLSWTGAYLRNPAVFSSNFSGRPGDDARRGDSVGAGRAVTGPGVERRPGLRHQEHGAGIYGRRQVKPTTARPSETSHSA
jgi:hypothetical protein